MRPPERVALALGAGGARGMAQIGVIEAIEARGLQVASIAGSSSGALVGGFHAAGRLRELRNWITGLSRASMLRLLDSAMGSGALMHGDDLLRELHALLGDVRIEALPIDLTIVAVDLQRQREIWLRDGDLLTAIRASIAIPGLLTPQVVHGRELVDGGLLAPLPITATRMSDAHRLVAVDMHGFAFAPPSDEPLPGSAEEGATRDDRLSLVERVARAVDTMQAQIARVQLALDPAELHIRIPRDACLFYEFWRAREMIEVGRAQADAVLDAAGF